MTDAISVLKEMIETFDKRDIDELSAFIVIEKAKWEIERAVSTERIETK